MIPFKKFFLFIIITCALTSCEYSYTYTYSVKNGADTTIAVHLKTYRSDTTYFIASDSVDKIYITDHGIEGKGGPYFKDVSVDLDTITVTKRNKLSTRNYRDTNTWIFNKSTGVYSAEVTNG